MGKVELNKKIKQESLLNTAFSLFTSKGFQNTSISDIVNNAGVAKGTFYLYFKDKYDIRNKLIAHKAGVLFLEACNQTKIDQFPTFEEKLIAIIDYIVDYLDHDRSLLSFLSKHLSWGVFRQTLNDKTDTANSARTLFFDILTNSGYNFKDPEIMVYMIIELVGGAIYSPILYEQPCPLEKIRPYLHQSVRNIIAIHILE